MVPISAASSGVADDGTNLPSRRLALERTLDE
jgi:hypothetical protein